MVVLNSYFSMFLMTSFNAVSHVFEKGLYGAERLSRLLGMS